MLILLIRRSLGNIWRIFHNHSLSRLLIVENRSDWFSRFLELNRDWRNVHRFSLLSIRHKILSYFLPSQLLRLLFKKNRLGRRSDGLLAYLWQCISFDFQSYWSWTCLVNFVFWNDLSDFTFLWRRRRAFWKISRWSFYRNKNLC